MVNPFIYLYFPIILLEILEFTSTNKHKKIEFYNTAEFKFYEKILVFTSLQTQARGAMV